MRSWMNQGADERITVFQIHFALFYHIYYGETPYLNIFSLFWICSWWDKCSCYKLTWMITIIKALMEEMTTLWMQLYTVFLCLCFGLTNFYNQQAFTNRLLLCRCLWLCNCFTCFLLCLSNFINPFCHSPLNACVCVRIYCVCSAVV